MIRTVNIIYNIRVQFLVFLKTHKVINRSVSFGFRVTDAQLRMIQDTDQKLGQEIATSHLFHTDNSGSQYIQSNHVHVNVKYDHVICL